MPGKTQDSRSKSAPLIEPLSLTDSERILARNTVGRIAFSARDRVNVIPVHFVYDQGWVYGRTSPGGKLLQILRNRRVAFEVDEHAALFDWRSVVIHGTFYVLEESGDNAAVFEHAVGLLRKLLPETLTTSDPVPFRSHLFRINAAEITGRTASPTGGRTVERSDDEPTESAVAETDVALRDAVLRTLLNVRGPDVSKVIVEVMEGIVILGGIVESRQDAEEIERAVSGIRAVKVVLQQMDVDSSTQPQPDPVDIARSAIRVLYAAAVDASANVHVVVENGWVRAEGTVPSSSLRDDIVRGLRQIRGAKGFVDRISVKRSS